MAQKGQKILIVVSSPGVLVSSSNLHDGTTQAPSQIYLKIYQKEMYLMTLRKSPLMLLLMSMMRFVQDTKSTHLLLNYFVVGRVPCGLHC